MSKKAAGMTSIDSSGAVIMPPIIGAAIRLFILYIVENADAGNAIDYKDNEAGRGTEAEGENEEYN